MLDIAKLEEEIKEEQSNINKQPKTMNELKQLVALRGEQWRADTNHRYENKKTGEIKAYRPDPSQTASELLKLCSFTLIGKGKSDKSPLYLYNPETGLYTDSDDMIDALIYAFDSRIDVNTYQKVKHIIRIESKFREQLSSKELLPVGNGILNKETKELHPFSPQYILTSKIATAYNPDVTPPIFGGKFNFNDWLKEIACNDEEVITLLWQVMNEAINPLQTRGKLVILTGSGNNGKGTFQDLLKNLVGEGNYSTLRPEQFKGFELGSLIGKTLTLVMILKIAFYPRYLILKQSRQGTP